MTTQNKALEADDSLWFFMSKKGDPVDDLKADPVVDVVYADPGPDTYVSVSGTAAMHRGRRQEAAALEQDRPRRGSRAARPIPTWRWSRSQIIHANYWDVKESKLVQLFAMAKAAVTGKPPASSASTAKCACAERGKGHAASRRRRSGAASAALFGASAAAGADIVSSSTAG